MTRIFPTERNGLFENSLLLREKNTIMNADYSRKE